MTFEKDSAFVREAHGRLLTLREHLSACQNELHDLQRFVSDYEASRPLSYEDFVRAERHIHPISDEHKEDLAKLYEQYRERLERESGEHLSRAQASHEKARDALRKAEQLVSAEREQQADLLRTLEQLHAALGDITNQLERPVQQLTVEHVQQSRQRLEAHEWGKPHL